MKKKIDTQSLIDKIERLAKERVTKDTVVSLDQFRHASQKARPTTVLLVEDDLTVRTSLSRLLEKEGLKVLSCEDGPSLSEVLDGRPIDLIILDVGLPWINGLELAQMIKENKDLKRIPIIFVSGMTNDQDVKNGFKAGADDYIKKPFESDAILRSVKTLLRLHSD